jgi:predicted  nucleic acid-binding Zn-ribbon protein
MKIKCKCTGDTFSFGDTLLPIGCKKCGKGLMVKEFNETDDNFIHSLKKADKKMHGVEDEGVDPRPLEYRPMYPPLPSHLSGAGGYLGNINESMRGQAIQPVRPTQVAIDDMEEDSRLREGARRLQEMQDDGAFQDFHRALLGVGDGNTETSR